MNRMARAVWQGTGKEGTGHLTSDSGILSSTPYSFKTRFENEPGTNPEELIAAAHAGCFTMALAFQLQGAGFTITKSALTLRANVPGIDRAKFEEAARAAEKNCPVSKVLNAEITMDFTLA